MHSTFPWIAYYPGNVIADFSKVAQYFWWQKVKNEKYNYKSVSIALIPTGKWYNIIVGDDPVLDAFDSEWTARKIAELIADELQIRPGSVPANATRFNKVGDSTIA